MTSPTGKVHSSQNKVDSSKKSSCLLEIRGKGLQFYITEFMIRLNCSD